MIHAYCNSVLVGYIDYKIGKEIPKFIDLEVAVMIDENDSFHFTPARQVCLMVYPLKDTLTEQDIACLSLDEMKKLENSEHVKVTVSRYTSAEFYEEVTKVTKTWLGVNFGISTYEMLFSRDYFNPVGSGMPDLDEDGYLLVPPEQLDDPIYINLDT